jgi:hypothetical protein
MLSARMQCQKIVQPGLRSFAFAGHDGYAQLEVDAHDDPAESRPTDLGEPGSGENAAAADMGAPPR